MTILKRAIIFSILTSIAAVTVAAPPVTRKGTSILHYQIRQSFTATEMGGTAAGSLRLEQKEQGNSAKQSLQLSFTGLEPGATYTLAAVAGDDTNAIVAGQVTTDSNGRARLSYSLKGNGKGKNSNLPDALNPLTDVRALSAVDAATQTVAYVWITNATDVHYMVKRNLTAHDENAAGSLSLIAHHDSVNFKLLAGGLVPDTNYTLAFNSNAVVTASTDASGRATINGWPVGAPGVLEVHLLQLLDSNTNVVLSTVLPK